ncbi:hypothetical protein HWV62_35384 [Athelia sp. TMB]|nr:hypothetical protein HWV62_35384 [Athelia sp. TMB]
MEARPPLSAAGRLGQPIILVLIPNFGRCVLQFGISRGDYSPYNGDDIPLSLLPANEPRLSDEMSSKVDDTDPRLQYSGSWSPFSNLAPAPAYNNTLHGTAKPGAQMVLEFAGTGISVYGTVSPNGTAISNYTIDGGSSSIFTAPVVETALGGVLYFNSSVLGDGNHTLVVTNIDSDPWFWIDYFSIE